MSPDGAPQPPPNPPTDSALLRAWAENRDHDAYAELENRYRLRLEGYAQSLVRSSEAASDVVQGTFLSMLRSAENLLTREGSLASWLFRVAHNHAISYIRVKKRRRQKNETDLAPTGDLLAGVSAGAAEDDGPVDELGALERCREALPERLRLLVYLLYNEGRTLIAAAPDLGFKTAGGVHRLRVQAEERLKECIERRLGRSPRTSGETR